MNFQKIVRKNEIIWYNIIVVVIKMNSQDITLLSVGQILGNSSESQL